MLTQKIHRIAPFPISASRSTSFASRDPPRGERVSFPSRGLHNGLCPSRAAPRTRRRAVALDAREPRTAHVSARSSSARESRAVVDAARARETTARAPAAGGDPMTRGARAESDDDAMEVGVSEEILEKGA